MTDSIDWTDETLRPLDELARLAFPDGGVTGKTLYRRAREGKLAVYRPGKSFLACLAGVRLMIEKTRVHPAPERRLTPLAPNSLGLTEMDLSRMALDRVLGPLKRPAKATNEDPDRPARGQRSDVWEAYKARKAARLKVPKQPNEEERAQAALAHRLEIQERRRVRARKRYRKTKEERAKDGPK
jgi:hypothetical protein